jgi:hypothetical protein
MKLVTQQELQNYWMEQLGIDEIEDLKQAIIDTYRYDREFLKECCLELGESLPPPEFFDWLAINE